MSNVNETIQVPILMSSPVQSNLLGQPSFLAQLLSKRAIKRTWKWITVFYNHKFNKVIYESKEYDEYTKIVPIFSKINTINDIEKYKTKIITYLPSITCCRLMIDRTTGAFYHDLANHYVWYIDFCDNAVYVKQGGGARTYVAKTIPEFLSHFYEDNINCILAQHTKHKYKNENLYNSLLC